MASFTSSGSKPIRSRSTTVSSSRPSTSTTLSYASPSLVSSRPSTSQSSCTPSLMYSSAGSTLNDEPSTAPSSRPSTSWSGLTRATSITFDSITSPAQKLLHNIHHKHEEVSPRPSSKSRHRGSIKSLAQPIGRLKDSMTVEVEEVPFYGDTRFAESDNSVNNYYIHEEGYRLHKDADLTPASQGSRKLRDECGKQLAKETNDWDIMMAERRKKLVKEAKKKGGC